VPQAPRPSLFQLPSARVQPIVASGGNPHDQKHKRTARPAAVRRYPKDVCACLRLASCKASGWGSRGLASQIDRSQKARRQGLIRQLCASCDNCERVGRRRTPIPFGLALARCVLPLSLCALPPAHFASAGTQRHRSSALCATPPSFSVRGAAARTILRRQTYWLSEPCSQGNFLVQDIGHASPSACGPQLSHSTLVGWRATLWRHTRWASGPPLFWGWLPPCRFLMWWGSARSTLSQPCRNFVHRLIHSASAGQLHSDTVARRLMEIVGRSSPTSRKTKPTKIGFILPMWSSVDVTIEAILGIVAGAVDDRLRNLIAAALYAFADPPHFRADYHHRLPGSSPVW